MSDLFLLSQAQMRRIAPYFPLSHGIPRVDDRRVISGIIFCDQEWSALARCAEGLWPAQDYLQPLHPMERAWGLQPDIRRAGGQRCKA